MLKKLIILNYLMILLGCLSAQNNTATISDSENIRTGNVFFETKKLMDNTFKEKFKNLQKQNSIIDNKSIEELLKDFPALKNQFANPKLSTEIFIKIAEQAALEDMTEEERQIVIKTLRDNISITALYPDFTIVPAIIGEFLSVEIQEGVALQIQLKNSFKQFSDEDLHIQRIQFNQTIYEGIELKNNKIKLLNNIDFNIDSPLFILAITFVNPNKHSYILNIEIINADKNQAKNKVINLFKENIVIESIVDAKKINTSPVSNGIKPNYSVIIKLTNKEPSINSQIIRAISKIELIDKDNNKIIKHFENTDFNTNFILEIPKELFGRRPDINKDKKFEIAIYSKKQIYTTDFFVENENSERIVYYQDFSYTTDIAINLLGLSVNYMISPFSGTNLIEINFPSQIAPSLQIINILWKYDSNLLLEPIYWGFNFSLMTALASINSPDITEQKYSTTLFMIAASFKINMFELGISWPFWGTPINAFNPVGSGYKKLALDNFMLILNIDLAKTLKIFTE